MMIIFFILALGSLAAWSGFYVFNSFSKNKPSELRFEIFVPDAMVVGESVEYRVRLTNTAAAAMSDVNLRLNYPEGFIWKSATLTPESAAHNIWNLGTIAAGEGKEIAVQGIILGESGGVKTIFGEATYHLPNFRSELESTTSAGSKLEDSLFKLEWSGPGVSAPGESVKYDLKYEHLGTGILPASVLTVVFSPNFKVTESSPPQMIGSGYQWSLPELFSKATGLISITGVWSNEAVGEETLVARLETKSDTGAWLKISSGSTIIKVSNGAIILSLKINDSTVPAAVNLGDSLAYTLEYENISESTIEEATIRVRYDSELIDWEKVIIEDNGKIIDGHNIIWQSESTPALVKVLPKSRGALRWTLPLVKSLPSGAPVLDIVGTPVFSYQKLDGQIAERSFEGTSLSVPVNGEISLEVEVRYFDDASRPVGSGPLPPRAHVTTTYRMIWRIKGSQHGLKDVSVRAELPAGVSVERNSGTTETGAWNISNDGLPEWQIDNLAPSLEPTASFIIALKPEDDDVGKVLALSTRTTLSAVDSVTGGNVQAVGNVVTTNLETDSIARGQGVVEK
ncbi:MAG: hypothetical protein UX68_C0004G0016 [Parcubacteria group bacterium GW2011_GWA2_46_9]|nr:MAG: hypothetical protein UX68_C0004G0016 [Parcubacteria group bacterium GW2011_GWA2_46_9]